MTRRTEPERVVVADVVEAALVEALRAATAAGRFDVVGDLARQLEARRLARAAGGHTTP